MIPNFQLHYNQGYAARPAPIIVKPTTERVSCQSGMAVMWNRPLTLRIKHEKNAVKDFCPERFAQGLGSELAIHEEIARMKLHIERPHLHALRRGGWEQQQDRAYQNLLQSALGFEPTDHSDAPPYIPTTPTAKPKPCVDFGFEPTEASE